MQKDWWYAHYNNLDKNVISQSCTRDKLLLASESHSEPCQSLRWNFSTLSEQGSEWFYDNCPWGKLPLSNFPQGQLSGHCTEYVSDLSA